MRRLRSLPAVLLAFVLAGLAIAWLLRFRVADAVVEGRLARAGVPAAYRITGIGPFHERLENLRIGDPSAPDLIARRVDLSIGYTPGPVVRGVRVKGARIVGRVGRSGLELGALDRLLPRTGGAGPALPDLHVALHDVDVTLATPGGTLAASLNGSGNPQRLFRGRVIVEAPALRVGSCVLTGLRAELGLRARSGAPAADGDIGVVRAACAEAGVALGRGHVRVAVRSDTALRRVLGRAVLAGFAGRAGGARFASVAGPVRGSGGPGSLDLDARLLFASAAAPVAWRAAVAGVPPLAGTPFAPTVARARAAVLRLLAGADVTADARVRIRGRRVRAEVARVVAGADGSAFLVTGVGDGLSWSPDGPRLDADVSTGGGALPTVVLHLRQPAPGAPLTGVASLSTYRAGSAALTVPAIRFVSHGGRTEFDGRLGVDGPIGGGMVRALDLPIRGWAAANGAFALGTGCDDVSAGLVRIGSVAFEPFRLPVCGTPLLARSPRDVVRVAAAAGPIAVRGRTVGGVPLAIAAAGAELSGRRFGVSGLEVELGGAGAPTRLAVAKLRGALDGAAPAGAFAGASARLAAVPLAFDDASGRWRFGKNGLVLDGALRIGDTAASPRFHPLAATGATFVLDGDAVRAAAVLREPASRAEVATVDVAHDLATGRGRATLSVDGLRFAPKGLQPDALTPATLGVVANVSGVVTGRGRIDWTGRGVTSTGSFSTERLDLAAAFGPVAGIRGAISFTDLLGLVSAPGQTITVAQINPGVAITDGVVRFALPGGERLAIEDARWPFARGTLRLAPTTFDLASDAERRLTFRVEGLDAGAFVQQLDLPNVSATGTFNGVLPMVFDRRGGRIVGGAIAARPPGGTIAYVGELTRARLGTMGKLAFDALKAIRYSTLAIDLDGQIDGEMVSRVGFTGVREATPERSLVARLLRDLPFRFDITVRAPFRGLVGTARSYGDPRLLLARPATGTVQPDASGVVP